MVLKFRQSMFDRMLLSVVHRFSLHMNYFWRHTCRGITRNLTCWKNYSHSINIQHVLYTIWHISVDSNTTKRILNGNYHINLLHVLLVQKLTLLKESLYTRNDSFRMTKMPAYDAWCVVIGHRLSRIVLVQLWLQNHNYFLWSS